MQQAIAAQLQPLLHQNRELVQQVTHLNQQVKDLEHEAARPSASRGLMMSDVRTNISLQGTLTKTLPSYDGKRSKLLEWMRDVHALLVSLDAGEHLPARNLITILSTTFKDHAKAWWSSLCLTLPEAQQPYGGLSSVEQLFEAMHEAFGERMPSAKARQRLMELKQRTSVDDYARKFAELVPYVADASRGELAHLFHRGLKPEVVKHLVSRINIEEDTWTAIRDKASDLDEVLFQQNRGSKTMASFPKGRTGEAKKPGADPMDWSVNAMASSPKQPLTKEAREYLIKNDGCFKCRKLGHKSFECPEKKAAPKN